MLNRKQNQNQDQSQGRGQDGSASVEFLFMVPLLLMVVAAVWFFGVRAHVQSSVDAAAAAAARDAALTSDASRAVQVAQDTVAKNLEDTGCSPSEVTVLNADAAGSRRPDLSAESNTITVRVSCRVNANPWGASWVPDLGAYTAEGKGIVDTRRSD